MQLRGRLKVLVSHRTNEDCQFAQRNCPPSLLWRQSNRPTGHWSLAKTARLMSDRILFWLLLRCALITCAILINHKNDLLECNVDGGVCLSDNDDWKYWLIYMVWDISGRILSYYSIIKLDWIFLTNLRFDCSIRLAFIRWLTLWYFRPVFTRRLTNRRFSKYLISLNIRRRRRKNDIDWLNKNRHFSKLFIHS